MANQLNQQMRIYHRYLGFFLVGIMAVYAVSGILLIFRDTDFLKQEKQITKNIKAQATPEELKDLLKIKEFKVDRQEGNKIYFKNGEYDQTSGEAIITVKELPKFLNKMTQLHKAKTADPLFFLNIFFGVSLLFFVISSFWMFLPKSSVYKKGMYFVLAGIVLTIVMLLL